MTEITDNMVDRFKEYLTETFGFAIEFDTARKVLTDIVYPPLADEGWVFYEPEQQFYFQQYGRLFERVEMDSKTLGTVRDFGRENFREVRIEDY